MTTRPAFTRTLQFADWTERYKAHMRSVIDHTFQPSHLSPLAQQWYSMIAADVVADTKKIYSTAAFQTNLNAQVSIPNGQFGSVTVPGLLPFIQARHSFLSTNAYLTAPRATLSNLQHTPASPNPTQSITVTVQADSLAAAIHLWYRQVGRFLSTPMFDDGAHGDGAAGDGTWGALLPAQAPGALVDYYVEAKTSTGAARYEPHTAELERNCAHIQVDWPVVPSPIVINEFVAQNVSGPVDENGQHEDWLELYNNSTQTVNVGGMWLSDSLVVLKWQIPAGTTIAPRGVLRVWCDEDGSQGPLHANFKLAAGGEELALYAASGLALHDAVAFGQQYADVSTGRVLDGGPTWATFPSPTHLATNVPASCGQRTYGALDPSQHGLSLTLAGPLQIGTTAIYSVGGGPPAGLALFALAFQPDHVDLGAFGAPGETLLLSPATLAVPAVLVLDGSGAASWSLAIPGVPGYVGLAVDAQVLTISGTSFDSSRAIELRICP